jgi:hypothetical protein
VKKQIYWWVQDRTRHTPAHRIVGNAELSTTGKAAYEIACPPGVAVGGVAITRQEAEQLEVFPCVYCFDPHPLSPQRLAERCKARVAYKAVESVTAEGRW